MVFWGHRILQGKGHREFGVGRQVGTGVTSGKKAISFEPGVCESPA